MKLRLSLLLISGFLIFSCAKGGVVSKEVPPPPEEKFVIQEKNPDILFQRALQFYDQGDYETSRSYLERFSELHPTHPLYGEVQTLRTRLKKRLGVEQFTIGLVLPMSGHYAEFGESVVSGVSCALGLFDPCANPYDGFRVVIKDSKGDPDEARKAVEELAEIEKAELIIGPLLSANAKPAAKEADRLGIPLISLAPRSEVASLGPSIFQHSLTTKEEINTLVDYVATTTLERFVILYPKTPYGEEFYNLFKKKIEGANRTVLLTISYDPQMEDFLPLLRDLKQKNLEPIDAIFIPDSYRRVSLIAQTLARKRTKEERASDLEAQQGMTEREKKKWEEKMRKRKEEQIEFGPLVLLGTMRWNHPNLLEEEAESLEGSVFVSNFYPQSREEPVQSFVSQFNRALGHRPGWLEALGYDTARMAMEVIRVHNNHYWPDIQQALATMQPFSGTLGVVTWDEEGISQWRLPLMTVRGKKIIPLKP